MSAAQRLRALWARPGVVRVAGAHDALGAKLAVQAGFDAIWSSGFEISSAHAVPDASILTMTEYLAAARVITEGVAPVPVIADCDTGYGSSNNVIRMVHQFEAAGVAAVCIEDKQYPKTNSFIDGRQALAPIAEFVGKLMAAKQAQRTADFAVIARTEALIAGWGVDEALRRCDAYVRAGADALLVHDRSSDAAVLRAFLAAWRSPVPIVIVPTTFPSLDVRQAEALGIKTVIYANQGIRAATRAMAETFARIIHDGSSMAVEAEIAPLRTLFDIQGMSAHTAAEATFDRGAIAPTRAILLHAGAHRDDAALATLTTDTPLATLDINGRALVQRQVDTLRQCGITDITVVAGEHAELVSVIGARVVHNPRWESSGEVGSLCAAPADVEAADRRTLLCYGDILVDRSLLERLLLSESGLTVVVDRSDAPSHEVRDRVRLADNQPAGNGRRFLAPTAPRAVASIGSRVGLSESHGEFAGLVLADASCWAALRARAEGGTGSVPDLLESLVADGLRIDACEVTSGWLEIRRFSDYEAACRLVGA